MILMDTIKLIGHSPEGYREGVSGAKNLDSSLCSEGLLCIRMTFPLILCD